jgi:hypothetical protein
MFAIEYNEINDIMQHQQQHQQHTHKEMIDRNGIDDGIIDNESMMIIVKQKRERKISNECEEMLRDLYDDIQEISVDHNDNDKTESDISKSVNDIKYDIISDSDAHSESSEVFIDYNKSIISAMKSDYEWNYTMPILLHICGFYRLKRRGTKTEIINSIVEFEIQPENFETVEQRKKIFEFMRLIKEHEYMKRFILFP